MDIRPGDVLEMKKKHPCGARRWEVLRVGMDFRLRCVGCGLASRADLFWGAVDGHGHG